MFNVENEDEPFNTQSSQRDSINDEPQAILHASHELSFETARTDANDYMQIWAWEGTLYEKIQPWSGKVAAAADDEVNINMRVVSGQSVMMRTEMLPHEG